jgi:hypothetical protein
VRPVLGNTKDADDLDAELLKEDSDSSLRLSDLVARFLACGLRPSISRRRRLDGLVDGEAASWVLATVVGFCRERVECSCAARKLTFAEARPPESPNIALAASWRVSDGAVITFRKFGRLSCRQEQRASD